MFGLLRCCTSVAGRNSTRFFPPRQSLYTCVPKSTIKDKAFVLMEGRSIYGNKNVHRQGSAIALSFASKSTQKSDKIVGKWMLTCSGMVFIAVVLGIIGYLIFYYYVRSVVKVVTDVTYGK